MPTDIRKLNLDDLLGRLYYANVNHEWDEGDAIKAEIARRIEVRDRVVRRLMDRDYLGGFEAVGVKLHRDPDDDTLTYYTLTYYDENGEQIL